MLLNYAKWGMVQGGYMGRERELGELLVGLDGAFRGHGAVFLIAGEPGIGKTALAERFASRAAERGARVVWSRSWEGGSTAPYWTWAQIIRALAADLDPETLRSLVAPESPHVTLLAPGTADRFGDIGSSVRALDSDAGRFYLFESTARFLKQVASLQPLVLVLDDVLAGDRASLLLLRFLARDIRTSRILLIVTYRDSDASSDEAVELLADLVREGAALGLRGLDRRETGDLVAQVSGVIPWQEKVDAIHEATAGNPLFIREVTRLLATREPLDGRRRFSISVPDSVRAVISRRLAPLSADSIQVLSAAAVVGRDFAIALVSAACDFPHERVLASLSEPVALGIIAEAADSAGVYRFSHPLMREAIYEGLPIGARAQMHQRVGAAIELVHGPDSAAHVGELAYHFARSAAIGDDTKALGYARLAGDRALDAFAYEEAIIQYRRALDALAFAGRADAPTRCELLLRLSRAQARAGDYQAAKASCVQAAEIARELNDPERLAQAALGYGEPQVEGGVVDRQLVNLLEEAIAGLSREDSALRARVVARLSLELTFSDDALLRESRRESLSLEAIDMARRLGDVAALCNALRARWLALWGPDGLEERTALADEQLALAFETGDREIELLARARRITCLVEAGDGAAAAVDLASHARLAAELRMPYYEWSAATMRTGRALLDGSFDEAEALAQDALSIMPGRVNAMHAHLNHIAMLRWEQGRLGEMQETWQGIVEQYPQIGFSRGWLCLATAGLGREQAARRQLHELTVAVREMPRNGIWLPALALAAIGAARLEDPDAAAALYSLMLPYARHGIVVPMPHPALSFGSAALYLAMMAARTRRWDDAEHHFEAAADANRRLGARAFLARTFSEHARMLIRRTDPSDRDRTGHLLEQAAGLADRVGSIQLRDTVRRLRAEAAELDDAAGARVIAAERRAAKGHAAPTGRAAPNVDESAEPGRHEFRRQGEYWTIVHDGSVVRLRDSKGLRCLARLLAQPGRAVLALDLEAAAATERMLPLEAVRSGASELGMRPDLGDAGDLLDAQARAAYRTRIDDLMSELDEAENFNDTGRAERVREEVEFLMAELARAVGLGGRDRKAASHAERARLNVTRAIRAAMRTLARTHPPLGAHLSLTIRTGRYCSYTPDPRAPITWRV